MSLIKIVRQGMAYYINEDIVPSMYASGADTRKYKESAEFVVDLHENKIIKCSTKIESIVDSHVEFLNGIMRNCESSKE